MIAEPIFKIDSLNLFSAEPTSRYREILKCRGLWPKHLRLVILHFRMILVCIPVQLSISSFILPCNGWKAFFVIEEREYDKTGQKRNKNEIIIVRNFSGATFECTNNYHENLMHETYEMLKPQKAAVRRCSSKQEFLKFLQYSQQKHLCWSLF